MKLNILMVKIFFLKTKNHQENLMVLRIVGFGFILIVSITSYFGNILC